MSSTPSSSSSATRAGTASTPDPSTSARLRVCAGTRSPRLRSPSGCQAGRLTSMAARLARSRPGSEGYRGRLMPSLTLTTAGSGRS